MTLSKSARFVLIAITLFGLNLSGCIEQKKEAVDFGPQTDSKAINKALDEAIRDFDPTATELGAYVYFQTDVVIAGGQARVLSSDVSQTVVQIEDKPQVKVFHLFERHTTFKGSGKAEVITREFELPFEKAAPNSADTIMSERLPGLSEASLQRWAQNLVNHRHQSQAADATVQTSAGERSITFHRLRTWRSSEPAPYGVQRRENCLGLAGCRLTTRHVAFDIVAWDNGVGDPIKIELVVSPEVPQISGFNLTPVLAFLPGLVRSCLTQLVSIGEGGLRSLVTECQAMQDFLYRQTPNTKPTP